MYVVHYTIRIVQITTYNVQCTIYIIDTYCAMYNLDEAVDI